MSPPPILVEALRVAAPERRLKAEAVDVLGSFPHFVHGLGKFLAPFGAFVVRLFRVAVLPALLPAPVRVRQRVQ